MRKLPITVSIVLLTLFTVCVLAGCELADADAVTHVTAVQIEDTNVYMAPYGEPSEFYLKPWVMPSDVANKGVTYRVLDPADKVYATVDTTGKVTATRAKEEGTVVVRIASTDNPKAYLDINITIEIAAVEKISFIPSEVNLLLGDTPTPIQPVFTPYHAILGRNVSYISLDEEVATVDALGNVDPVGVGKTTIWVTASNDQNLSEEELVKGNLQLSVSYTPPNYKLSIANPAQSCKQIIGAASEITLALDKMDTTCDPTPTIRWRVAGAPIPKTEDYKIITYLPTDLPRGEYTIQATVTDASSQEQVLYSDMIYVYEMLTGIDIMVYNTQEELQNLAVNDTLRMEVSYSANQYPPDNYRWSVYRNGQLYETKTYAVNTFYYKIKDPGEYSFTCEAIIQGKGSGVTRSTSTFESGAAIVGNDIYNVYVTARKLNTDIVPYVAWDPLYYNASYTATIQTTDSRVYTLSSSDAEDMQYYTQNGLYIPAYIATLSDSFSVTLRSSRYGWTETKHYAGDITITNEDRQYFDTLVADFDGYIQNMEEMGRLLNYVNVFRPEEIRDGDWYRMTLKIPFDYDAVSPDTYPLPAGSPVVDPAYQDVMNVVFAAFNCYGDSVVYTPSAYYDLNKRELELSLKFEAEDDDMTATDPAENGMYTNENVILHYTDSPRSADSLPIDSLTRTMAVETGMQLYYAVALGYRPIPADDSSAELLYEEARGVLRRIIGNQMTDAQKVHAIYDFLTAEIIYDRWLSRQDLSTEPNIVYESFHLEGVFLRKLAVCDGIAKAFTLLCGMEGIASVKINGVANGIGHAWNKVLVDGAWYVVDATWGSYLSGNIELQTHRYLLTTDAAIQATHIAYGKQQLTKITIHPVYYGAEFMVGANATIDTDAELSALVIYMYDRLDEMTDSIWVDFVLSDSYYASFDGVGVHAGLSGVVSEALSDYTGLRYSIDANSTQKYAAVRLELR